MTHRLSVIPDNPHHSIPSQIKGEPGEKKSSQNMFCKKTLLTETAQGARERGGVDVIYTGTARLRQLYI